MATLDVLSGGRATCGVGLGWFEQEHAAWGWDFPPGADRYRLLQDTLRLLPLMWGKGSPAYDGGVVKVPETLCYPRPHGHVPVIVGGGGERRTLRLAAQYADAANVFGEADVLRHKASVLRTHAEEFGRATELTQLSTVLVGTDDADLDARVNRHAPRGNRARWTAATHPGTVADHVTRFRGLQAAGAAEVMARLADVWEPGAASGSPR